MLNEVFCIMVMEDMNEINCYKGCGRARAVS